MILQKMDNPWIQFLNSPELVIKIQECFGVKYESSGRDGKSKKLSKNGSGTGDTPSHQRGVPSGTADSADDRRGVTITNKLWYYLFIIGTEFGDETFYASFIPFWFWNVDGAVGRRFVFVWCILMYIGQAMKDILRCPRPGYPVVKLQASKWTAEYGLPSTHAIVGVSIPFSILFYTQERYEFSFAIGLCICIAWCTVICVSRLYLGMHSVLDVIVGLGIAFLLLFPLMTLVDKFDYWLLSTSYSPLIVLVVSILLVKIYPQSDKWTPTRGDTTLCIAVCSGIQVGAWFNYKLGYIQVPLLPPPYPIIWPSHAMLGLLVLRTVLGLCCVLATKAVGKSMAYAVACAFLGRDKTELIKSENTLANTQKILVDLSSKYVSVFAIGLSIQFLLPNVFRLIGINRPDFYTEI